MTAYLSHVPDAPDAADTLSRTSGVQDHDGATHAQSREGWRRRHVATTQTDDAYLQKKIARNAYLQKVIAAGGIKDYERIHLATLTATVKSKLRLPACPARRVVEYAFHVGNY